MATIKEVELANGQFCIVNQEDYSTISEHRWDVNDRGYVWTNLQDSSGQQSLLLHRLIMGVPVGSPSEVDHRNGDKLDNRRDNLRICTHRQNLRNQKKQRRPTSSQYKGVSLRKDNGKWQSYIRLESGLKHLGQYEIEVDAARAYDEAAKLHFGEFANLNFKE